LCRLLPIVFFGLSWSASSCTPLDASTSRFGFNFLIPNKKNEISSNASANTEFLVRVAVESSSCSGLTKLSEPSGLLFRFAYAARKKKKGMFYCYALVDPSKAFHCSLTLPKVSKCCILFKSYLLLMVHSPFVATICNVSSTNVLMLT